jgi:3-hydroxyisobutyrate dehydrogenase-like beta-hydroxyacid dehydrogenase
MKDFENAMRLAKELNMPLMSVAPIYQIYTILKAKGRGKGYYPEVITVFEEYAGVEARIQD